MGLPGQALAKHIVAIKKPLPQFQPSAPIMVAWNDVDSLRRQARGIAAEGLGEAIARTITQMKTQRRFALLKIAQPGDDQALIVPRIGEIGAPCIKAARRFDLRENFLLAEEWRQ